ncbi:MAG: adenylate/guanylate cyclase domain-containing protein [Spirochaetes bacterium]|nr:adenylate/guanylate cyclase domain-containing protein [Spirochaetota bacterium]
MAQWTPGALRQKIETLAHYPRVRGETARALEAYLPTLDDWDLSRLNPRRVAEAIQRPFEETLDAFLHGVRIGLLDFRYNLICPLCGGLEHNFRRMDEVMPENFHCTPCDRDAPSHLDEQVEVAFSVNEGLARLDLDWTQQADGYRKHYFSPNYALATEFQRLLSQDWAIGAARLEPGESLSFPFDLRPGEPVHLMCMEAHARAVLEPEGAPRGETMIVDLDLTSEGFSPARRVLPPGPVDVRVRNATGQTVGVAGLRKNPARFEGARMAGRPEPHAWLTARDLLNHQTFRDLFKVQDLDPNLRLSLKSLTLLFTDLKGSTEMYDRAGDISAYQVVQEHFEILTRVVREHRGAVIKTMGDAIMAAFSRPEDAAQAAIAMSAAIQARNLEWRKQGWNMGLKVGVHEGSALAVNADERLDYFGQTVNIAARVQGLSAAGEIWMTETVWNQAGVAEALRLAGYASRRQEALLKGVGNAVAVRQCSRAALSARPASPTAPRKAAAPRRGRPAAKKAKPARGRVKTARKRK